MAVTQNKHLRMELTILLKAIQKQQQLKQQKIDCFLSYMIIHGSQLLSLHMLFKIFFKTHNQLRLGLYLFTDYWPLDSTIVIVKVIQDFCKYIYSNNISPFPLTQLMSFKECIGISFFSTSHPPGKQLIWALQPVLQDRPEHPCSLIIICSLQFSYSCWFFLSTSP